MTSATEWVAYTAAQRAKAAAANRAWRRRYPARSRAASAAWRRDNLARARAGQLAWQRANPDKVAQSSMRYYARKKGARVPLSPVERTAVSAFYAYARWLTVVTGIGHQVDHVVPITKGGIHHPSNLQVLTATENRRKSAKYPPILGLEECDMM